MYNRYIPQPDGTYRRSAVPDRTPPPPPRQAAPSSPSPRKQAPPPPQEHPEQPGQASHPSDQRPRHCRPPQRRCPRTAPPPPPKQETGRTCPQDHDDHSGSVAGFLKNLLPRDFDTGDLLIVILLLLMSADCSEDQNTALLTLVLYLFL